MPPMSDLNVNEEATPALLRVNHQRHASVVSNRRVMLQPRNDRVKDWFKENLILALTVAGVLVGVIFGTTAKILEDSRGVRLSSDWRLIIAFPGEILMRMLKSLVVPLVTASLISGLAQLDISRSASMGRRALVYYFATTLIAVILGIVLVLIIHPGDPAIKLNVGEGTQQNSVTTLDAFLDLIRNLFPDNIVQATFMYSTTQYVTKTVKVKQKPLPPPPSPLIEQQQHLTLTTAMPPFIPPHGNAAYMLNNNNQDDNFINNNNNNIDEYEQPQNDEEQHHPYGQQRSSHGHRSYSGGTANKNNNDDLMPDPHTYMIHHNEDNPNYNGGDFLHNTYTKQNSFTDDSQSRPPPGSSGGIVQTGESASPTTAPTYTTEQREERVLTEQFGMNMLGLIMFSIAFGLLLTKMGERGQVVADFFTVVNEIMMQLVMVVVWYSPIGIASLIAGRLIVVEDLYLMLINLARYMFTVVLGLVIHACIVLPSIYYGVTRKNPFRFMKGMLQAWLMALATASSSAAIPFSFHCLEAKNGVDMRVSRFVVPIGATVNMDGTALYEAVAAIFIGQMNGMSMDLGKVITISLTATLASVGAASVPSAGLVTMIIVLASVGLPIQDVSLIVAVDWLLDRLRTSINVLGDAFGAGIVDHLSKAELAQLDAERAEKNMESYEPNIIITAAAASPNNVATENETNMNASNRIRKP